MNKRLLYTLVGSTVVLIASLAIYSSINDDSNFQVQKQDKLPSKGESSTFLQKDEQVSNRDEIEGLVADFNDNSEATPRGQKLTLTTLIQTQQYVYDQLIDSSAPRINAIITTDKSAYKARDVVFIEVLLMDAIKKVPYLFPIVTSAVTTTANAANIASKPQEIPVSVAIFDLDGNFVERSNATATINSESGSTAGFAIKLSEYIKHADYMISVASTHFPPVQRVIQLRKEPNLQEIEHMNINNSAASGDNSSDQVQPYTLSINILNQKARLNDTIFGTIVITTSDIMHTLPTTVDLNQNFMNGGESYPIRYNINNIEKKQTQATVYFELKPTLKELGNYTYFFVYASVVLDNESYFSPEVTVQVSLNNTSDSSANNGTASQNSAGTPNNQNSQQLKAQPNSHIYDAQSIRAIFQTEQLSDLAMNITQRVYFYTYLNFANDNKITGNYVDIQNAHLKAYNLLKNSAVVNISEKADISTTYNGFGSFLLKPEDFFVYFLEIPVPSNLINDEKQEFNDDDNTTMDGHHFVRGAIRIPIKVEGIQTRHQKYVKIIEDRKNPTFNSPKFNLRNLRKFNFSIIDQESGLEFSYDNGFFTLGQPRLPPLMVFNGFPNPADFSNMLGFVYKYMQGIMENPPSLPPYPTGNGNYHPNGTDHPHQHNGSQGNYTNQTGQPTDANGNIIPPPTDSNGYPIPPPTGSNGYPINQPTGSSTPPPTGSNGYPINQPTGSSTPPPTGSNGYPINQQSGSSTPPPTDSNGYPFPPPTGSDGYPINQQTGSSTPPPTGSNGYPINQQSGSSTPPPTDSNGYAIPPPTGSDGYPIPPPTGSDGYPINPSPQPQQSSNQNNIQSTTGGSMPPSTPFPNGSMQPNSTHGNESGYQSGGQGSHHPKKGIRIVQVFFDPEIVVEQFVRYTIGALWQQFGNDVIDLNFTQNPMHDLRILSRLFNGTGVVQANSFGKYGPAFLEPKCGNQSATQIPPVTTNVPRPRRNDTPAIVMSIGNKNRKVIGNVDELIITVSTNSLVDQSDFYLMTLRQKEQILHSQYFQQTQNQNQMKIIKLNDIDRSRSGIMTVNLYRVTEEYFILQDSTNASICDYNTIQKLIQNGTLQIVPTPQQNESVENTTGTTLPPQPPQTNETNGNNQQSSPSPTPQPTTSQQNSSITETTQAPQSSNSGGTNNSQSSTNPPQNTEVNNTNTTNNNQQQQSTPPPTPPSSTNSNSSEPPKRRLQDMNSSSTTPQPIDSPDNSSNHTSNSTWNNNSRPNNETNYNFNNYGRPVGQVINGTQAILLNLPNNKTCIHIDINQAVDFIELVGSINFFRKPQTINSLSIRVPKVNYMFGEQISGSVILNKGDSKRKDEYVFISVTEDNNLDDSIMEDLGFQLYLKNELDENALRMFNPRKMMGMYYGNPSVNASEANLELLLAASALNQQVFDLEVIQQLLQNAAEFGQLKEMISLDELSLAEIYGYNLFRQLPHAQQMMRSQEYERERGGRHQESDITTPYRRASSGYDAMTDIPVNSKRWIHDTPASYNRSAAQDLSETLYFSSAQQLESGQAKFSFKMSDLETTYKITANFYGPSGIATTQTRIKAFRPFNVACQPPQVMAIGDNFNVTCSITNYSPQDLNVTPAILQNDRELSITLYPVTKIVTVNKQKSTISQSFVEVPANSTQTYTFNLVAARMSRKAKMTIEFTGAANDSIHIYRARHNHVARIIKAGHRRTSYSSGYISTAKYSNGPNSFSVQATFPEEKTLNTTKAEIVILPSYQAFLRQAMEAIRDKPDETIDDIILKLDLMAQVIQEQRIALDFSNNDTQVLGPLIEYVIYTQQLLSNIQAYQQYGKKIPVGYDYVKNSGKPSPTLTAIVLSSLQNFNYLQDQISPNSLFQINLKWLLSKRDGKGNIALGDSDIHNRGNQQLSFALIVATIGSMTDISAKVPNNTRQPLLNLSVELNNLLQSINKNINTTAKFENLKTDPLTLAITIIATTYSQQSAAQQTIVSNMFDQLLKHQLSTGQFDAIATQAQSHYSIFNGQGIDRVIEATATAILAMKLRRESLNDTSLYQENIASALKYLLTQVRGGLIGGNIATSLTMTVLKAFSTYDFLGQNVTFDLYANDELIETREYYGGPSPIKFTYYPQEELFTANQQVNFKVMISHSQLTNQKDVTFGIYTVFSYLDNNFTGVAQTSNSLGLTITNAAKIPTLTNGADFRYTINIRNINTFKSLNQVKVTVPIPSCVDLVESSLIINLKDKATEYKIDKDNKELIIYGQRGTAANGKYDLTIPFKVNSAQRCVPRIVTAQVLNGEAIVSATPSII